MVGIVVREDVAAEASIEPIDSTDPFDADPYADAPDSLRVTAAEKPGASRAKHAKKGGIVSFLIELPILIVVALVVAVLIKTFLIQAFFIPSGSMIPTLEVHDRVMVNKLSYTFSEPQR